MSTSAWHRYVERSTINNKVHILVHSNWSSMWEMRREVVRLLRYLNYKTILTCYAVLFVIRTSDQKLLFGYATSVTSVHMGDDALSVAHQVRRILIRRLEMVWRTILGISDAYYCAECTRLEKDRDGCPKIVNLGASRTDLFYERRRLGEFRPAPSFWQCWLGLYQVSRKASLHILFHRCFFYCRHVI